MNQPRKISGVVMNFQYLMSTKWVFAPILRLIHEIILFLIILIHKIIYITFYIIRRNSKIEYFAP